MKNARIGNEEIIEQKFELMEKKRREDADAITILEWWSKGNTIGAPPNKTEQLPRQCGSCYWVICELTYTKLVVY